MNSRRSLAALLAGRWQVPLALLAAVAAGLTFYRLLPRPAPPDFPQILSDLRLLEQAGNYFEAADAAANLLELRDRLSPDQTARLHEFIARVIFEREVTIGRRTPANLRKLVEHERLAAEQGAPPSASRLIRLAHVHEWLAEPEPAMQALRAALRRGAPSERREAALMLVRLLADEVDQPGASAEQRKLLEELLEDPGLPDAQTWRAAVQWAFVVFGQGDLDAARLLIPRLAARFQASDRRGYAEFLLAWLLVAEGRTQEVEPVLDWIYHWIGEQDERLADLDLEGNLAALERWLRARVHLLEDRPQPALEAITDAFSLDPRRHFLISNTATKAAALARLGQAREARELLRGLLRRLERNPRAARAAARRLARQSEELAAQALVEGRVADALADLELAAELGDGGLEWQARLARTYEDAAQGEPDAALARGWFARAGECAERAAALVGGTGAERADWLWSAGGNYDRAGRIAAVQRVVTQFVALLSPDDVRLPRALLLVGQTHAALGDPAGALRWYERLCEEYPALEESARARVLRAEVLLAMGPGQYAAVEGLLTDLLDGGQISPEAVIFREALERLVDLLLLQNRSGEAIGRLENALALLPAQAAYDSERVRLKFTLADAYRNSGLALLAQGDEPSLAEGRRRLELAAERFGLLAQSAESSEHTALYQELAQFYQADCLFEVNEPETLAAAIPLYRRAAAQNEGRPAALTAYVQIANIHLRRGETGEARRIIEQARWQLQTIPDVQFQDVAAGGRAEWERFFDVLSRSSLLSTPGEPLATMTPPGGAG